jgi:hypothetical protein
MAEFRSTVLSLYRRLYRRAELLPTPKRASALEELRCGFRDNAHVSDQPALAKLVQQANSKLAFLKMITPTPRGEIGASTGRYVFRDGEMHQGQAIAHQGARHSAYDATNLDPEAVSRHHRLIERQHFGGRGRF